MEKRDKLAVVSIETDNEVILHILLKGPPNEYLPFCSAMTTRNEPTNFDDLHIVVISEEYSIKNIIEDKQEKNIMNFTLKKFHCLWLPKSKSTYSTTQLTLGGRYGHLFPNKLRSKILRGSG